MTPQEFVTKWHKTALKERSAVQEHFIDICRMLKHPTPAEDDPTGERFTFEAGAAKQKGGQGWADVWKRGFFAWEYKGKHADLGKAYQQLLQYREALQNPPILVVSDIDNIVIHTNFTNTVKQVTTLTLDKLLTPEGQRVLRSVFYEPERLRAPKTTEQVTKEAAREFAKLAEQLRKYGEDPHRTAHFLIRLLFCLFAEDIGLLPNNLFTKLVTEFRREPALFTRQLRTLFGEMASGGLFGVDRILHFNGGLFDNDFVLELDGEGLGILGRVALLDWGAIEPSILGTLFERSLDPSKRSQLGAHYTSKEDILLIVEPVLMQPLRRKWEEVKAQAVTLAEKRVQAKSTSATTKASNDLRSLLLNFSDEIASVKILDPACGSGNFLYVALKELLDLQKEVSTFGAEVGAGSFFPTVDPKQLYGIELNAYAHELAQATVWIGYIQWLRDNGFGQPSEPILKPLQNIKQMDAILAYDEDGKPVEPEWPEADVIIGNPPFLGRSKLRSELGDSHTESIWQIYKDRVPHGADLVTYWFEKARSQIEGGSLKRAGLLATQAIRAGASRQVLERIKTTGDIFYAQADRPWVLDGADVRVSMIGFDSGSERVRRLNTNTDDPPELALSNARLVEFINADLSSLTDVTQAKRLLENLGIAFMGTKKVGSFDIDAQTAQSMLKETGNPNNRPNSDVVRPWINGYDVVGRSRDMWIIDFGSDMPQDEAALYEAPFEYVARNVKPVREQNRQKSAREKWWLHERTRPEMREALEGVNRFIVTPRVAKHRLFGWVSIRILPDSRLFVFSRDDDYFFGVLHSRVHEVWSLATSSRHGDGSEGGRPTYNNTTCFETFPLPWPPGKEPEDDPRVQAIAQAAKELVEKRDNWLNPPGLTEKELRKRTLTNLYNQRPTWLDLAHQKLDRAVLDAYGWPHDLSDEQILERLLALNLERAKSG